MMPRCVGGRQRVGHGSCDAQYLGQAQPLARNQRVETGAAHVLHHDEVDGAVRLDLVDRDDVRMIECGGGLRFLDKATATLLVVQPVGRQHLDGDFTTEPRVPGAIHLAHPPSAERREDFVGAEL